MAYCTSPSQKCNDFHGRLTLLGNLSSHEKETIFVTEKCALYYNNLDKRAKLTHKKHAGMLQVVFQLSYHSTHERISTIYIYILLIN